MYAIIKCGGKQYKVEKGETIVVDQLTGNPGDKINIDDILMVRDEHAVVSGLDKAKVTATIVEHFRGDKIIVFKYKAKKNYRRKNGHRSYLSKIKIEDIKMTKPRASKKGKEESPVEEVTA
ncbi:MAG: 50S ribosomal protein L21 [Rubrobacteridae bacterium]|nr:50S ribosomal protein L21 [Rubrobacteridae bacterium]